MMTDKKIVAGVLKMLDDRVTVVANQINAMFDDEFGHSYGMPEWYNTHDYASGAWKAKNEALNNEFDFLNKLINTIEDMK